MTNSKPLVYNFYRRCHHYYLLCRIVTTSRFPRHVTIILFLRDVIRRKAYCVFFVSRRPKVNKERNPASCCRPRLYPENSTPEPWQQMPGSGVFLYIGPCSAGPKCGTSSKLRRPIAMLVFSISCFGERPPFVLAKSAPCLQ